MKPTLEPATVTIQLMLGDGDVSVVTVIAEEVGEQGAVEAVAEALRRISATSPRGWTGFRQVATEAVQTLMPSWR